MKFKIGDRVKAINDSSDPRAGIVEETPEGEDYFTIRYTEHIRKHLIGKTANCAYYDNFEPDEEDIGEVDPVNKVLIKELYYGQKRHL